jgi:hypothetical protein
MLSSAALILATLCVGQAAPPAAPATTEAGYLLSAEPWHGDPEVFWPGFLNGLRGFEHFYNPVGNPIYFEPPTNTSELRFLYLHHNFPSGSVLQGGDVRVAAVQARLALTERLSFIATKDGYSWLDANVLPKEDGWNALAAGLKYTFYVDREADFLAAAGVRYMLDSGQSKILQGGVDELSPFLSFGKGWGPLQLVGSGTWRAPLDDDDGNHMAHWDLHLNYEVFRGFAPLVELRGMHYLSDGERTNLPVGGADYTNLGSNDVSGNSIITLGFGARARLTPHISLGALYEFNIADKNDDIFDDRFTVDLILRW